MSWLESNLTALAAVLGASPRLPDDRGGVRVDRAGAVPVLHLATPGGGHVALNSRRDPLAEAKALVDSALQDGIDHPAVVAIGLGLGFVIDAIEERCANARIIALEPEPRCVRALLERRDLTGLIADGRLLLLWGPEYLGASQAWRLLPECGTVPPTITHPVLARVDPAAVEDANGVVGRMVFGARSNAEARRRFAGRYLLNSLRNLPIIARSGNAGRLFGTFSRVPCVIVSAGPSLDANIEALAALDGRALIVSVDTALRPLLSNGIDPHLAVALDPSELNAEHLVDLPRTGRTHLVAEGSLDPRAFNAFDDRIFTFKVSDHQPWPWLRTLGLERATLRAWGSVATSAFDLAVRIGCDPIVFVGQDLAYSDRRPYCRETTFERAWAESVVGGRSLDDVWREKTAAGASLELPDFAGRMVRTTPSLVAFRDWLVEQCRAQSGRRFINASGAGILAGPGIEQLPLSEAIPAGGGVLDGFAVVASARRAELSLHDRIRSASAGILETISSGKPCEIANAWHEFTGHTETLQQIAAALSAPAHERRSWLALRAESLRAITRLHGLSERGALPATARLPERVAGILALAAGEEPPAWAAPAPATATGDACDTHEARIAAATQAVSRLLRLPEPARGLVPGLEHLLSGPGLDSLCLTAGFEWAPEARADVNLLERQAAFARKTARPTSEDSATAAFRWSVPPSTRPGLPRSLSATMPVARETLTWWARRALVVEWARLLGQDRSRENDTTDAGLVHLAAWLRELADDPLPPGIDEASVALETSLEVASRTASFGFDLQTPLWRLMRALTGAVRHRVSDGVCKPASAAPAGFDLDLPSAAGRLSCVLSAIGSDLPGAVDPRTCFLRPDAWVVPSVLPLPASYLAGQGPGATALVTPHLAQASWAVDATGHLAEQAPWPHPIIGEERGPRGLAVAWSNAGSWYLMRRASATEPADVVTVPFRPARAVVLDDGSCLWTATTGGLWRWDTDGRVERVATVPPVSGITLTEAGVRLDPIAKDVAGHGHRSAREHGWLWNPGSPGVTELDLGPLGQACRRAGSGRKWAAAYPAADLIQVGDASGHRFDVACDWPNDIAWAGDSLVAVTAQGTVLLFAGLAELLG